jgi:hypothetical protein
MALQVSMRERGGCDEVGGRQERLRGGGREGERQERESHSERRV